MSSPADADFLLVGASELVTCAGRAPAAGREQSRVAVIEGGALAARAGRIVWVGPAAEVESRIRMLDGARRLDVEGRAVLPGLVDTHTHLVWAGGRADEFERRLAGASYGEILAGGGGILRTVEATRSAGFEELREVALRHMEALARFGVTAMEVKSGYGLETATEIRMLEAALAAGRQRPFALTSTFLGAHTLPRQARGSAAAREEYLAQVTDEMIPAVARRGLARFVDVFIDRHAFSVEEARRVFLAARDHGLGIKVHAGQLAADGGAELAAEMGAVSADHLEHLSPSGVEALARAGTVGVLLPGATLFLRSHDYADGRRMVDGGMAVAVATDFNPGSCPSPSLPLMMQLACLYCGLSVDEAIVAATLNAAAASGLEGLTGSLEPGKRCDLLILDSANRRDLLYHLGSPPIWRVIAAGHDVGAVPPPAA
ncbi:MAG: imidazolonepropionase [Acidobacteriota bacterium]|nr:imidazolonepropionase [Acidobacteriota bacterium]